jgi:hypothetical protein
MAAIAVNAVSGPASEVVEGAKGQLRAAAHSAAEVTASTRAEVDLIARTLCAVSRYTNLSDALLSLYDVLEPAEARQRTTLVLDRMRTIMPHDLPEDLAEVGSYSRPWADGFEANTDSPTGRDLLYRFAMPAMYLLGAIMLTLSVVGSITSIHYLLPR